MGKAFCWDIIQLVYIVSYVFENRNAFRTYDVPNVLYSQNSPHFSFILALRDLEALVVHVCRNPYLHERAIKSVPFIPKIYGFDYEDSFLKFEVHFKQ